MTHDTPPPTLDVKASPEVMIEHTYRDDEDGFWIDIAVDRQPFTTIGPFDTAAERKRAGDDLLEMTRSLGAKDVPPAMQ